MFSLGIFKYPKQVWALSGSALLVMAGFSFLWPLTMIYVTQVLHRSVSTAGIVLSVEAGFGLLGSMLGGILFDKIGGKRTIVTALVMLIISSFLLMGLDGWWWFVVSFVTMAMFIGVIFTSIGASAGLIWPEGGNKSFTFNYLFQNIGVAIGTALGGIVAAFSFRMSFFIMALIFICALLVTVPGVPKLDSIAGRRSKSEAAKGMHRVHFGRSLFALLTLGIGNTFVMVSYIQWQTTVPVLMNDLGIRTSLYSLLWTLNGILVITLQPLIGLLQQRLHKPKLQFALGIGMFLLAFAFLLFKGTYPFFVAGMIALTLGEMIVLPYIPAFTSQLAPVELKGTYQGIINVFKYCGRLLGPIIGTGLYQHWGAVPMLIIMIIIQVIALAFFLFSLSLFQAETSPDNSKPVHVAS